MYPFGHVGITVLIIYVASSFLGNRRGRGIDYRAIILGSLLPDIVDKPIGILLGISGRNIMHTLAFTSFFTVAFVLPMIAPEIFPKRIVSRVANPMCFLPIGVWTHLFLDKMWQLPDTVLWPAMGFAFPPGVFDLRMIFVPLSDPWVLGGEIIGLISLLAIALRCNITGWSSFVAFLRDGRLKRPLPRG